MDAYDRCTKLEKKILTIVLPSLVEAENLLDQPRISESLPLGKDVHSINQLNIHIAFTRHSDF
jgi:hypothetical protein